MPKEGATVHTEGRMLGCIEEDLPIATSELQPQEKACLKNSDAFVQISFIYFICFYPQLIWVHKSAYIN